MLIITGGVAPASPVGESLGECLVRGRRSTKVNSFSCLSFPPAPQGPRHSGLQLQLAPPPRRPSQRPPFRPRVQSGPFTRVPWASRPRPPPAPRHWSHLLPVSPGVPPTTAPPSPERRLRSFPTAGTLRQLSIGPVRRPLLLIGGRFPPWAGPQLAAAGADWPLLRSCRRGFPGWPAPLSPQAEACGRPWKPVSARGPLPAGGGGAGPGPGRLWPRGCRRGSGGPARAAGEER